MILAKDKFVDLTCEKCHTDYRLNYNSYSTRRRKNLPNLCPKCMKERLSEFRKNYFNNLSDEEKKTFIEKRNWHARVSEEEKEKFREKMKNVYRSLTDEEKEELNRKNSEGLKKHWATVSEEDKKKRTSPMINRTIELLENMTPEERSDRAKNVWKKIEPDRKKELIKLYQEKMKKYNDSVSLEEKQKRCAHMNDILLGKSESERKEIYKKSHEWLKNEQLYLAYSESRKNAWKALPEEIKKERIDKIKEYWENLSEEDIQKHIEKCNWWETSSEEEREKFRKLQKYIWTSDKKAELSERMKKLWNELSEEEKELIRKRASDQWAALSEEEKKEIAEKAKARWENKPEEEKKRIIEKIKDYYKNLPYEKKVEISERQRAIYNSFPKEKKEEMVRKSLEWRKNLTEEEKIAYLKKVHVRGKKSSLHTKFESYFKSSEINNHFYYVDEDIFSRDGVTHSWDYGIYDENGELQMVVDLDGSYYHGDCCDYDGLHSQEEYDEKRFLSVPDGVKYHIIYEKEWTKSFERMIKLLMGKTYDEFVQDMFKHCRLLPDLPYMHYTDIELLKSYDQLLNLKVDKYRKNVSINNREGDRIINHFHHSIYQARCKGFKYSPYDAWYQDDLLLKIIKNRIIYINKINPNKILQGFNIAKVAKRVTVFSAGRAKILIENFLSDWDTIFDPFSGFSGRMLGTISAGKKYMGQDISPIHINESKQILSFLRKYEYDFDVDLKCVNILESSGKYPCLFTCPPYADKEQWLDVPIDMRTCDDWIDICLERFKCKKYLFVVDYTERYKEYEIESILNKSHMNKNQEHIVFIEK